MTETVVLAAGLAALFAERGARSIRRERALGAWPRPQGPVGVGESLLHHRGAAVPIAVGFVVFTLWGPLAGVAAVPGVATAMRLRDRRRSSRLGAELDEQLADAVRALASALRAGLSVPQAIGYASRESVAPLRATLATLDAELELGSPFDDAIDRWAQQVGTDDARLVAGVLRLNRRSGGDLPATLDQVATTLRERHAAAREVRALTAQARLSGTILGVLPVGFFAFLWLTSREEIEGAFQTPAGIGAIGLGLFMEGLAFLWIRSLLEVR